MLGLRRVTALSLNQLKNLRFSSSSNLVDVSVNDKTRIATVTMQRAPVNGLNLELILALDNALDEVQSNKSKGMILTSANPTIFSAGLDIMEMYKPNPERLTKFWTALQDCWYKLYSAPYPTAAAINGHSPAGGCLLATSCEYRVMVEGKYTIGLNETALGIVAPSWFQGPFKSVLPSRTAEFALTSGKLFTVAEALKVGLIDETATDKADAVTKCEKFIGSFAKISPLARAMTKAVFRSKILQEFEEIRENDLAQFVQFAQQPAIQKGLELYLESLKKK